jgi:hypothetical protein
LRAFAGFETRFPTTPNIRQEGWKP